MPIKIVFPRGVRLWGERKGKECNRIEKKRKSICLMDLEKKGERWEFGWSSRRVQTPMAIELKSTVGLIIRFCCWVSTHLHIQILIHLINLVIERPASLFRFPFPFLSCAFLSFPLLFFPPLMDGTEAGRVYDYKSWVWEVNIRSGRGLLSAMLLEAFLLPP